jgi:hypothetical protein
VGDKESVVVDKPKEGTEFYDVLRNWPIPNSCCFGLVHLHLPLGDYYSQVVYLGLGEGTFLWLEEKLVASANFKDLLGTFQVFFFQVSHDEKVIYVYEEPALR